MSDEMSKSAKKRAAAKARAAAYAQEHPEVAAPVPKAEPKGKAKAKAEPAPAPKAEPKAKANNAPKAEAKSKAKAKAKQQAEAAPPPTKKSDDLPSYVEYDDGQGGEWEVASVVDKKQQRRLERQKAEKEAALQKEIEEKKAATAARKAAEEAAKAKAKAKAEAKTTVVSSVLSSVVAKPAAAAAPETPAEPDPNVTVSMEVPSDKIGRIVGPKGANIELIKTKTNVKTVDTTGGKVTIIGLPEDVAKAETAVKELVTKGYMSLAFEDFKEGEVTVAQHSLPNIIGSRGSTIQAIKKECQVEIDIPKTPEGAPKAQKVKVQIAGGAEGVEKAKECIASIAAHGYHQLTHPGYSHAEMEVEEWKFRFLIGKGGSEMRHIQNSYKVKVTIPREGDENKNVVVMGEGDDVGRAVRYIERQLENASEAPKPREAPEKAVDTWGDEPEEEAWMSQYMYKSRGQRK